MVGRHDPRAADRSGDRPVWRAELRVWLAMLAFYGLLTSFDRAGRERAAAENGRLVFGLERAMHLDVELAINQWLVPRDLLRVAANYEYAFTYLASSFALLVWAYRRRPATYRWARSSFILINVIALTCFAVFPVAPPRLIGDLGFVDTVVQNGTWGSWGSPLASNVNQLAAMPSLHIAWALWVSLILGPALGGWLIQSLCGLHVILTLLVIVATANHYLLDAAGGAFLALVSVKTTRPQVTHRYAIVRDALLIAATRLRQAVTASERDR